MAGIRFMDDCFTLFVYLRNDTADRHRAEQLADHFIAHAFPPSCILEVETPSPFHVVCGCRFDIDMHGLQPTCHLQSKNLHADPSCMSSMKRTLHTLQDATAFSPAKKSAHSKLIAPIKRALHYCHPPFYAAVGIVHTLAELVLAGHPLSTAVSACIQVIQGMTLPSP